MSRIRSRSRDMFELKRSASNSISGLEIISRCDLKESCVDPTPTPSASPKQTPVAVQETCLGGGGRSGGGGSLGGAGGVPNHSLTPPSQSQIATAIPPPPPPSSATKSTPSLQPLVGGPPSYSQCFPGTEQQQNTTCVAAAAASQPPQKFPAPLSSAILPANQCDPGGGVGGAGNDKTKAG